MKSTLAGLRTLILPWGAGTGTPRTVIGPDLPPALQAYTFRDRFTDPVIPSAAIVNYSTSDDDFSFLAWGLSGSGNQMWYLGKVVNGSVVTETDLDGNEQIEGMTLDFAELSVALLQWNGGNISTNKLVDWDTQSYPFGEDENNIAGVTSTTYTPVGSPIFCGCAFQAPRSGSGTAIYSCRGESNVAGVNELLVSPRLRTGSTIGAGFNLHSPSDNVAIEFPTPATSNMRGNFSNWRHFSGLTPFASYNLTLEHRVTGDSGDIFHRQIKWLPDIGNT